MGRGGRQGQDGLAFRGIGLGRGTDAEGWITEAVAFWESQTAAKAADTAA